LNNGKANDIVTFEELQLATGYKTPESVVSCLIRAGVKFLPGKGDKIWTTIGAMEAAMGLSGDDEGKPPQLGVCREKGEMAKVRRST